MNNESGIMNHATKRLFGMSLRLFFILYSLFFILYSEQAHAAELSLGITPPTIVIQTSAPALIERTIEIENKTNDTLTLTPSLLPFTQSGTKNGKVTYNIDNSASLRTHQALFEKTTLVDNQQNITSVTLLPKQKKPLTLRIELPEGQPNNDYYFSILFVSKSTKDYPTAEGLETTRAYTHTEGTIGMHVLLSVYTGQKQPEGFIDTYKTPLVVQGGPVPFSLQFTNTGNYLLTPQGTIVIKNMFGQTVGKLRLPKTNVLAHTTRVISITWPEHILFGAYTADLFLTIPDSSIAFERKVSFVAFPFTALIGIIALIIAFALLRKRVNRYLS